MYLNRLPDKLKEEVRRIANAPDGDHPFNHIFSEDPVFKKLEELDFSMDFERLCTQTFLGLPIEMHGEKFKAITPLVWHVLWSINSPLSRDDFNDATVEDMDVFFYLIENGFDGDFASLKHKADCYCLKRYTAEVIPHLPEVMIMLIRLAFFPLTFYPSEVHTVGKQKSIFDVEWLASITSLAHLECGDGVADLMKKPLQYSTFYFLEYAKQNGTKDIGRQPLEETLKMKVERVCELLCDWFVKQNLITEDEKDGIFTLLTAEEVKKDG